MTQKQKDTAQADKQPGAPANAAVFEHFFERLPDLACVISADGLFQKLNLAWEQTLGYTRAELLGQPLASFIHPQDVAAANQAMARPMSGVSPDPFTNRWRTKDGADCWLEWSLAPAEDGSAWYAAARDVTRHKQMEQAGLESNARWRSLAAEREQHLQQLQAVLSNAPLVLSAVDLEGKYILSQGKGLAALGRSPGKLPGKTIFEIYQDRPEIIAGIQKAMRGETTSLTVELGGEIVEAYYEPVRQAGQITGVMAVTNIITARKQAEEALRLSELDLREAQSVARIGNWKWNIKKGEITWSDEMYRIFGIDKAAYTGRLGDAIARVIHPDDLHLVLPSNAAAIASQPIEYRIILPDGSIRHIWAKSGETIVDEAGNPIFLTGVAQDITERKRTEEDLRESEARFRGYFEQSVIGAAVTSLEKGWLAVNQAICDELGYTQAELAGLTWAELTHPDDLEADLAQFNRLLAGEADSYRIEKRFVRKDGQIIHVDLGVRCRRKPDGQADYFLALLSDITERKRAEEQIKKSLVEKEILLRELYHRTKNNMGVIIGLLELQADDFEDVRLRAAFQTAQNRIRSMALVHQKLYETQDLSRINLRAYIHDLAALLIASYSLALDRVRVVEDMQDVFVLIDTAIPCGLIVNEVISNALKYAFPGQRSGEIRIELRGAAGGEIELDISDNGVGLAPGFDLARDGRMGLMSIQALGENQLHGQVALTTQPGVSCRLCFRDNLYQARV